MKKFVIAFTILICSASVFSQTLYVPGSVGSSTNAHVGIGISSPETTFHIQTLNVGVKSQLGVGVIESKDTHLDLISSSADTWGSAINLIEGNGTTNQDIWSIVRQTSNGAGNSSLRFNFGTVNSHLNTNMVTFNADGNVGIGTTTPDSRLDVTSNSSGSALRLLGNNLDLDLVFGHLGDGYGYYWRYKGTQSGNDNDLELWSQNQQGTDILIYRTHQDGTMGFHQSVAFGDLNVPSGYRVAIDGRAIMEEIKVEVLNPPDYVFSDDYSLLTLQETERYIKEHRHLPEIPAGSEMESNGVELGEMNMLLLKKIEELTLYLIEQNKEIKELKEKVQYLENQ